MVELEGLPAAELAEMAREICPLPHLVTAAQLAETLELVAAEGVAHLAAIHQRFLLAAVAVAVVVVLLATLAVREAQGVQAEQALLKLLTAYLSHQEARHPLQLVAQEVKSLYHGTHNK